MNPAAGLLAGDNPVDVQNALWDATGFMYPRSAFKLFNGRTRMLGNREIGGMFRYVRRSEPPFFSAQSSFLAADSQWVYQDSSVTDSLKGFKKMPIGTNRGSIGNITSGNSILFNYTTPYITAKWLQYIVPIDPFMGGGIDSGTYLRVGNRAPIKIKYVWTDDTLELVSALDTTAAAPFSNFKIRPAFDVGTQKHFSQIGNRVIFGDSTKPIWAYDGIYTQVNYICDSGRVYVNTTTLLRDGTKAWFPNQWRSYWVRFSQRMTQDRGGAAGTDSIVLSPWCPITGNDDTSLTLKFDPDYGNAGAVYYIMALPSEKTLSEQTVGAGNAAYVKSSSTAYNFAERDNAITSWPLSILITDGPGRGELRSVSAVYGDTLFVAKDNFLTAPTTTSRFSLIANFPVISKTVAIHQDRAWYVDQNRPSRIYYSEPLQPSNVGPFNYVDVSPRDGDALTSLASHDGELVAYKNNSMARIIGDNPSNFVALPFLENLGTPGINSRTAFRGAEYFYDYRSGIYELAGGSLKRLSDPVKPLLDSIPSGAAKNAALTFFKDHLWFAYPAGANQSKNNRLLTYHVPTGNWARHTFTDCANFAVWPLAGDSSRLTCGDPDSGLVYVYTDTAHIDAYTSTLVKATYKTGWMALSDPEMRKRFRAFHLAFDSDSISGAAADKDSAFFYKDFSTVAQDTLIFLREGTLSNYVAKDMNGNNLGRLFKLEMRLAPRTTFRLYSARIKWRDAGERQ